MSTKKHSLDDCVRELKSTENNILEAIKKLALRNRITKTFRLNDEELSKVKVYLEQQQKQSSVLKGEKKRVDPVRKVGGAQVVEKRVRAKPPRILPKSWLGEKKVEAESVPKEEEVVAKPKVEEAKEIEKPSTDTDKPQEKKVSEKLNQPPLKDKEAIETVEEATKESSPDPLAVTAKEESKEESKEEEAKSQGKMATEKLYKLQVAQQEKSGQARPKKQPKGQEKKPGKIDTEKKSKEEVIRLKPEMMSAYRKKRKQNISRGTVMDKMAENIHAFQKPTEPVVKSVKIHEAITVSQLATEMSLKSGVVIRKLMDHGMSVTANEMLDKETAWIVVEELGHQPIDAPRDDAEEFLLLQKHEDADLQPRAPVVTVMGHVDHGKTTLLDYIRETRVAGGEAGGITQHVGAYRVDTSIGSVTFIDTPGHALFSKIRARGAKMTDIIVLVVAADDGVKQQTKEAISHAKASGVPIVVAINKVDKSDANVEKVKGELAENGVLPEDWGGDSIFIPVSALSGEGVDNLLEALAIQTELLELKAPIDVPATAVVIDSRVDKGRGIVATIVVTKGILKRGDAFLCGAESGRVRAMWNLKSPLLKEAGPSVPVEIQGLSGVPAAGVELLVVNDERKAREIANLRQGQNRAKHLVKSAREVSSSLSILGEGENEKMDLKMIIKADVEGSREAMVAALENIESKKVSFKIVHSGVGAITESDIYLAQTSSGLVIGYNTLPDSKVRKLAESRSVQIIVGNVIYDLVEKAIEKTVSLLPPIIEEKVIGSADVMQIFNIRKVGNIAGCRVKEGVIRNSGLVRLSRDGAQIYEGRISCLRHFKDEVAEVRSGMECGIAIAKFNDIKSSDVIEFIERIKIAPDI